MTYTTIRIPTETHQLIKELSKKTQEAQQEVVNHALRIYEEQQFWEDVAKFYEDLVNDPVAYAEELEERKLYENTLMDGLEDGGEYPKR